MVTWHDTCSTVQSSTKQKRAVCLELACVQVPQVGNGKKKKNEEAAEAYCQWQMIENKTNGFREMGENHSSASTSWDSPS